MGKLRKIGRKIKKGVKKLFSSKIGKIVGMVGLYFALGAAAKGLSNWFSSSFGKAGAAATETTAVVAEGAAATGGGAGAGASKTIGSVAEGAATTSEATNAVIAGADTAAINGATNSSNTITEALTNVTDSGILDTPVTEVKDTLNFLNDTKGKVMDVKTAEFKVPEVGTIDTSAATELMNTTPEYAMDFQTTTQIPDVAESPSRMEAFATNTKEATSNVGQNIKDYFVGDESTVIPDTISGVGTGMIMSQFQEEPEMSGGYIAPQPVQVQAQGAYMQEVGPIMASVTGVPNFSNFTQMANQNVYGIGTPNHLAGLYG